MRRELKLDWLTLGLYLFFILFGWLNIYAASTNDASLDLFNFDYNYGKQFVYIAVCMGTGLMLLYFIDLRDIEFFAYIIYGLTILLLIYVMLFGREINGAKSWIEIGSLRLQPSEFAKIGSLLAIAKYMSQPGFNWNRLRDRALVIAMMVLPALLIRQQGDTGTALVYIGLIFMFYREGLSPLYLIFGTILIAISIMALLMNAVNVINLVILLTLAVYFFNTRIKNRWSQFLLIAGVNLAALWIFGIQETDIHLGSLSITGEVILIGVSVLLFAGLLYYFLAYRNKSWRVYLFILLGLVTLVFSIDWIFNNAIEGYQRDRIVALFNPEFDPKGINWNTTQSKIAIGSGGLWGKGYLEGTQTKFDFVPQQHTDFIFCTIGEEWGWLGSAFLIILFFVFLAQMVYMAEECKSHFGRIFGYGAAGLFFVHIAINVAMTIGFAPVIGIPLPFFSYGGSSLLSFTLMYFIVLKFYANRANSLATTGGVV